jgi:hypothetical protein
VATKKNEPKFKDLISKTVYLTEPLIRKIETLAASERRRFSYQVMVLLEKATK